MNVNKLDGVYNEGQNLPEVVPERPRMDVDIYDLRRQIDNRETVKEYIKSEIARLNVLLETMTREIISLDLQLNHKPKPAGEPNNKRYLYSPEEVMRPRLTDGASNAIEGEIVE